jgi:hypothetical protein
MVMQDAQQRPTTPSPEPAAPAVERPLRSLGARAAGPNRYISVAGALALTEPGPAAAGLVVADRQGRVLAQRAHYLGQSTRAEAAAQALLTAARLALASGLEAPVFRTDDHALYDALTASPQAAPADAIGKGVLAAIREVLAQLPGSRVELIPPSANEARAVALAPLVDWLPERTRRAEVLHVQPLGEHVYAVESESQPGLTYRVTLRPPGEPGEGEPVQCECADFLYRGIPCKHLLAVARQTGALDRLFYRASGEAAVPAAPPAESVAPEQRSRVPD